MQQHPHDRRQFFWKRYRRLFSCLLLLAIGCAVLAGITWHRYTVRTGIWDEVVRLKGEIRISIDEDLSSWCSSKRFAFGMGWCEITSISVSGAANGDEILNELGDTRKLEGLRIWDSRVTDRGLAYLKQCPELESLGLGGNDVSEGVVAVLRGSPKLTYVDLGNTRVTDSIGPPLMELRKLDTIRLGNTQLTDRVFQPSLWRGTPTTITLLGPSLSGHIFGSLPTSIRWLNCENMPRIGTGLESIEHLIELRSLVIEGCDLTTTDGKWLGKLTHLGRLVSINNGSHSALLMNCDGLSDLGILVVSGNRLSKGDWKAISQMKRLSLLSCRDAVVEAGDISDDVWVSTPYVIDLIQTRISESDVERLRRGSQCRQIALNADDWLKFTKRGGRASNPKPPD